MGKRTLFVYIGEYIYVYKRSDSQDVIIKSLWQREGLVFYSVTINAFINNYNYKEKTDATKYLEFEL